jgi:hypothetical protein
MPRIRRRGRSIRSGGTEPRDFNGSVAYWLARFEAAKSANELPIRVERSSIRNMIAFLFAEGQFDAKYEKDRVAKWNHSR